VSSYDKEYLVVTLEITITPECVNAILDEGGYSPWFTAFYCTPQAGDLESARIVCWNPDEEEGVEMTVVVSASDIANAMKRIARDRTLCPNASDDLRKAIMDGDASYIDAEVADCVLQMACYKEIVFG
jgi:hypothetical protein